MKILHFIDSMRIGGSEGQTAEVAARQVAAGHTVTIGCLHLDGPHLAMLKAQGIDCQEFPLHGGVFSIAGLRRILGLASYIRRQGFDVVHTHDLYSNLIAVPAAALARTRRILSSRRDLASWWWYTARNRRMLRWIQGLSHLVLANSQAVKDFLVEKDGFKPARIAVIRNAVDVDRFQLPSARDRYFAHWSSDSVIFLMVANMHTHTKGHQHLIHAAASVCRSHPMVRFALVGDGALRGEFESMVTSQGLAAYFQFMGARTDVPQLLASCDATLLASLAEGLPNSVLEYLSAGKPCIASRVGGIPELITDHETGLLVPPSDPAALAFAIASIMDDRELAMHMGKAGQTRMRQEFSYERLLAELDKAYVGASCH
jgi:glycosyltransferase involved in cell wall biosynthesis